MLQAFARLVADLFPAVNPEHVRELLSKHWSQSLVPSDLFALQLPPKICQGDILGPIRFVVQDDTGDFGQIDLPGMLLSHSCDLDNEAYVVVAACRSAADYTSMKKWSSVRNNTVFNLFYLAGTPEIGDTVVDFGALQSVNRRTFDESVANGSVRRIASLTMLGYYFLIVKLTAQFLRPQPVEEVRHASEPPLGTRVREGARGMASLVRYIITGRS